MSFHLPFALSIEPIPQDDGTLRLLDPTGPFDGSRKSGKRGAYDARYPVAVAEAYAAWEAAATAEDMDAALAAGFVDLPVNVTTGQRGAPRQSAASVAERIAAKRAAAATPEATPATRSRK